MTNFWQTFKKPIFLLAPMEGVTDTVFRQIINGCGKPDVMFTEFTNADGLCSPKGTKHVSQRLKYTELERPIVAQIWGNNPETFYKAAQKIVDMGFDGLDINMGCPEKNVVKKHAGGGCILDHALAKELISAAKEGLAGKIPLSVKTRIGFKNIETENWIGFLLEQNFAALTVHLRTVKEMSDPPAHWEEMEKIIKLKIEIAPEILIFGNGDINSIAQANEKIAAYGIDGVMMATGIFSNPWLFADSINLKDVTVQDRLQLLLKHVALWDKTWGNTKNFQALKKYFKIYIQGFPGASELRTRLMECNNRSNVEKTIKEWRT